MRDSIELSVRTAIGIGSASFARAFIHDLCRIENGRLSPEYFNLWEPINRSLAKEGIDNAVKLWSGPNEVSGGFLMRRRRSPQLLVIVDWGHPDILRHERFPWFCSVHLESLREEKSGLALMDLLVSHFAPQFGYGALSSDHQAKHEFVVEEPDGQLETYIGVVPEKYIPGIYWLTFLGPWAIELVGRKKIESLRVGEVESIGDGYLIRAYPHIKQAGTPEAHEIEEAIKAHLGKEHFFDRSQVDIEKLRTPPHERKAIREAVEKMKAAGKKSWTLEVPRNPDQDTKP